MDEQKLTQIQQVKRMAMDDPLNTSNTTTHSSSSSASTSVLDIVSLISENEIDDATNSTSQDVSFISGASSNTSAEILLDVRTTTSANEDGNGSANADPGITFEMTSFPTNPTLTDSSSWASSSSLALPPEVIQVTRRSRRSSSSYHRRHYQSSKGEQLSNSSTPYAQLCFDPNHKTLVTMLEIDIVRGRRKHHSRLPLDSPTPNDFPWLHQGSRAKGQDHVITTGSGGIAAALPSSHYGLYASSSSCSASKASSTSVSSLSEDHQLLVGKSSDDEEDEEYCEPIILSGWMMDHDSMSDEEADIYWLLNDGKDVWVKLDDGCAKALRKMWSSCSQWKVKRYRTSSASHRHYHGQEPGSPDPAREEKRFRYSILS